MGVTLNGIGNYYQRIGNNDKALEYYMKVLKCKLSRYHIATAQLNIIPIHIIKKDHYKAFTLIIEAQNTLQNIRPSPHAEIIKSYILFGNIYLDQQKYKIANGYYVTALEMSEELAIGHDCRTNCIIAFADFYNKQSLNKEAIEFCHKKLSEYEEHLPSNHIANAYLLMKLGELYDDNHEEKKAVLERALHILEESFHLEYETTATCLMMIAQYYQNKNQKIDALQYYKRALEIRHKIYPDDHLIIKQTMQGIFN
jgi:tetratricopeptide (TPR) repeat protein